MKIFNKRGFETFNAIEGIIFTLVVAAIILGVGLFSLQEVRTTLQTEQTIPVVNETYNGVMNGTAFVINGSLKSTDHDIVIPLISITNETYPTQLNAAEWKVLGNGTFTWLNATRLGGTGKAVSLNFTYDYLVTKNDSVETSLTTSIDEMGGIADWFGILIAVGMIAIILALLYIVRGTSER